MVFLAHLFLCTFIVTSTWLLSLGGGMNHIASFYWVHLGNGRGCFVHDHMKGTRRTGEASPQFMLGEFQAQLYNSSLLFFSFSFLPLPSSSFTKEAMKTSRRGGHSLVQPERACHCQTSIRSKWCFGHATRTFLSFSQMQ